MTTACALMQQQHVNAVFAMFAKCSGSAEIPAPDIQKATLKSPALNVGASPHWMPCESFTGSGAIQTESEMKSGILLHGSTDMGKTGLLCARCSRIS